MLECFRSNGAEDYPFDLCRFRCGRGDLYDQAEDLAANHKLNSDENRAAHEIRTLGRNGAHPEWEPVTEQMATIGWALLVWLCKHVYEHHLLVRIGHRLQDVGIA